MSKEIDKLIKECNVLIKRIRDAHITQHQVKMSRLKKEELNA